jgi:hypothetical protein
MKTTLYRYFDSNGQLLYVGITGDNTKRQSQHRRNSFWFGEIASATFEHFEHRAEALLAEKEAIQVEKPLHNIAQSESFMTGSRIRIDFTAKTHLVSMLNQNEFSPDVLHRSWAIEVRSWLESHECFDFDGDTHFIYHLYELESAYLNGERKFQVHESCEKCKDIFESEWYLGGKQFVIDSLDEYERELA